MNLWIPVFVKQYSPATLQEIKVGSVEFLNEGARTEKNVPN